MVHPCLGDEVCSKRYSGISLAIQLEDIDFKQVEAANRRGNNLKTCQPEVAFQRLNNGGGRGHES